MKAWGRFLFKLLSRDPNTGADVHGSRPSQSTRKNGAPPERKSVKVPSILSFSRFIIQRMPEQFDSPEQLQEKLAEILSKWPLYRTFVYTGKQCHKTQLSAYKNGQRFGLLPKQIRQFCDNKPCGYETLWENSAQTIYFGAEFINQNSYTCRNCGKNTVRYCYIWQERDSNNIFLKVGQYPELEERVPDTLKSALDAEDLKLYKNALRMRNFNLGVAAVAYMRRVIENKMNDMLEILHEAAIAHNAQAEVMAHHKEMMEEKRFSIKVDYAGTLLPASLRPSGKPNPMAVLHELASDGLHAKSDEECVDIFDACRRTFEFVFGKLRIETEDARTFVTEMAGLADKKSKASSQMIAPANASATDAK
jgi:hypothetical protein